MKVLNKIESVIKWVSRVVGWVSCIAMAVMIAVTVLDVILRKTVNKPIVGSYELVQYLLLICVFASFAYCQVLKGHIQVTMIVRHLPPRIVCVITALTGLFTTAIMLFIAYAAAQQAQYAAGQNYLSDVLKMPVAPFVWLECICMVIFALACFMDVLNGVAGLFNKEKRDELIASMD